VACVSTYCGLTSRHGDGLTPKQFASDPNFDSHKDRQNRCTRDHAYNFVIDSSFDSLQTKNQNWLAGTGETVR
jgi:hypothetical protein